jgi:hypothetical protein
MQKEIAMKKKQAVFFGFAVLLLAAIFTINGCNTGTGGGTGGSTAAGTVTYTATKEGKTYTLVITENTSRAAYTPQRGDTYVLTITPDNVRSTGTVESSGTNLTLKPSNSTQTFTVAITGSGISTITGTITLTDNTTVSMPGSGSGSGSGSGGGTGGGGQTVTIQDLQGTWLGQWEYNFELLVITSNNFEFQQWQEAGTWTFYASGTISISGATITTTITSTADPVGAPNNTNIPISLAANKQSITLGDPGGGIFKKLTNPSIEIPNLQGTWLRQDKLSAVIIKGTYFELWHQEVGSPWQFYCSGRINFDGTAISAKISGGVSGMVWDADDIISITFTSSTLGWPVEGDFEKLTGTENLQGTWTGPGRWLEQDNQDLKCIIDSNNDFKIGKNDATWDTSYWEGTIICDGETISAKLTNETTDQGPTPPAVLGTLASNKQSFILGQPVAGTFEKHP